MVNSTSPVRTPLAHQIQQLAAFEPTAFPVLSLYLDLSPGQHGRDQHQTFVRKALGDRVRSLRPNAPERESFDRDAARIEQYLRDEVRPSANGLAIFACSGRRVLRRRAARHPGRTALAVHGAVPHLYPLARLIDQYPRYAAVMLDTNHAQIFVFGLIRASAKPRSSIAKTRRSTVGGWSQARYQRHADNLHLQHVKEVVETLDRIVAEEDLSRIVVIGDDVAVPTCASSCRSI